MSPTNENTKKIYIKRKKTAQIIFCNFQHQNQSPKNSNSISRKKPVTKMLPIVIGLQLLPLMKTNQPSVATEDGVLFDLH